MLGRLNKSVPELAQYSDAECERMVWEAKARRADAMWLVPVMVGTPVACAVLVVVWGVVGRLAPGAGALAGLVSAAVVWGVLWVWVRRVLIVRSMLMHHNKAACPYCLFNLQGLAHELGVVVCPECGQRIVLADEGIHLVDLAVDKTHQTWTPKEEVVDELPSIPLVEPEPKKETGESKVRPDKIGFTKKVWRDEPKKDGKGPGGMAF